LAKQYAGALTIHYLDERRDQLIQRDGDFVKDDSDFPELKSDRKQREGGKHNGGGGGGGRRNAGASQLSSIVVAAEHKRKADADAKKAKLDAVSAAAAKAMSEIPEADLAIIRSLMAADAAAARTAAPAAIGKPAARAKK
jgi:hypothetical protein